MRGVSWEEALSSAQTIRLADIEALGDESD